MRIPVIVVCAAAPVVGMVIGMAIKPSPEKCPAPTMDAVERVWGIVLGERSGAWHCAPYKDRSGEMCDYHGTAVMQ